MLHGTNGSILFNGDIGTLPITGTGSRLMWIPELKAFRAGGVDGTQWDIIGNYSSAFGFNNVVTGEASSSFGMDNLVSGESSLSIGEGNEIKGNYSFISGLANTIEPSNYGSFISGSSNTNSQNYTFTHGFQNTNNGINSVVFGNLNRAEGQWNFVCGVNNIADMNNSTAIGYIAETTNNFAVAIGSNVYADGEKSFALGSEVKTNGYDGSFAIGDQNGGSDPTYWALPNNQNQMVMRFTATPNDTSITNKTFRFITSINADGSIINEAFLTGASNGLILTSDRNKKKNITPVNNKYILNQLRSVPINIWKWKDHWTYSDSVLVYDTLSYTWMGPIAQDFYKAFPIGFPDSTTISTSVLDAVMFASIQELGNVTDTLKENHQNIIKNESKLQSSIDSMITKSQFYSFIDSISCFNNLCNRVDKLESDTSRYITKVEFKEFQDSISCYLNACERIKSLEETVSRLSAQMDSLLNNSGTQNDSKNSNTLLNISTNNIEDIVLEQNNPNPFSESSQIYYYIPQYYKGKAKIMITDESGNEIYQKHDLNIGKPDYLIISASELQTGVFLYMLVLNDKVVKTKKFIIIK